jgi:hypothetical protein
MQQTAQTKETTGAVLLFLVGLTLFAIVIPAIVHASKKDKTP